METKEANEDKIEDAKLTSFGARHTLALMLFFGCALNYAFRVNLSVAIVAMVKRAPETNTSEPQSCPVDSDQNSTDDDLESTGEFDWDESTQGLILSSYFYGYVCTNIIGGVGAEYFGRRNIVGGSLIIMAIMTMLSPLAANVSSTLLIVVRILEGLAGGMFFPALSSLVANWYPKMERSKFASFIYSGIQFGTVVTLSASGWLCSSDFLGGWPSAFYTFGVFAVIWAFFWFWLIRDNADEHPTISEAELKYITAGCPRINEKYSVPWKFILTSKYVWIITFTHFGEAWGFYTVITEIPTYMDTILHIDLQKNGLFTALPYIGGWFFTVTFGYVSERLISNGSTSLRSVRIISMIFGGYGPMICLVGMCFVNCNATWAIILLFISGTLNGSVTSGYLSSHADIAPRFAGALVGLTCTCAGFAGIFSPILTGILTKNNETLWAWREVFLISTVLYLVPTTVYILFITTETQHWNEPLLKDSIKDSSEPSPGPSPSLVGPKRRHSS